MSKFNCCELLALLISRWIFVIISLRREVKSVNLTWRQLSRKRKKKTGNCLALSKMKLGKPMIVQRRKSANIKTERAGKKVEDAKNWKQERRNDVVGTKTKVKSTHHRNTSRSRALTWKSAQGKVWETESKVYCTAGIVLAYTSFKGSKFQTISPGT